MNIGERIKKRREELGMSVADLAQKVGKSRATVYRYENGAIEKLPTGVLIPFAEALSTTPAFLMGWTDNKVVDQEEDTDKTLQSLLELYDNLSVDFRSKLLNYAEELDFRQKHIILEDRIAKVKEEFREEYGNKYI